MTARQQRRLYETAFDSCRAKREVEDIDRLSPVLQLQGDHLFRSRDSAPVARAASRSSFGSTSGSSASSTPTHQPMLIGRDSPRQRPLHLTPQERRKVTLFRDLPTRSQSPQARLVSNLVSDPLINRNHSPSNKMVTELSSRKIAFGNNRQWDSASDRSSSQESMDAKEDNNSSSSRLLTANNSRNEQQHQRNFLLGKSSSRDNLAFRNLTSANHQSNDWKDLTTTTGVSKLENSNNGFHKNVQDFVFSNKEDRQEDLNSFVTRKNSSGHTVVKVLPTDNACLFKPRSKTTSSLSDQCRQPDPLRENTSQNVQEDPPTSGPARRSRPFSLAGPQAASAEPPLDNAAQSPVNDRRPADDYDPPWEFKAGNNKASGAVNGSVSVPERLFQQPSSAFCELPSSVTSEKLDGSGGGQSAKPLLPKLNGPPSRTNLNLNLNLNSDSPRKARQGLTLNFGCSALSAVGEKVDAELTLEKQGWYHGSISRLDAENLLRVLKEGSYLVRNSESSKQDYSLSLKSARGFMHMKIVHNDGRFILGQFSNPFASIPEMIHHYSINKLPIKGAEHMSLLYPVIDQLL